jgi:ribosome-binding protein aMBF1 (putative translation factor)
MECAICYKGQDQVELFEGIYNQEIIQVCNSCAIEEGIPVIRKPSSSQIEKSKEANYSVRDRMERISGMRKTSQISDEQSLIQGRMARLREQPKKQNHPDVLDNYYWTVNMARRRRKMSTLQLSTSTGISKETIEEIEKGIIPQNFKEVFKKLEYFFGEKLLKEEVLPKIKFTRKVEVEEDILDKVRRKMRGEEVQEDLNSESFLGEKALGPEELKFEEQKRKDKKDRADNIKKGTFDFSDRKRLENVTLSELVEIKKERERREKERIEEEKKKEMMGDEVDLEE